eukprot:178712_1
MNPVICIDTPDSSNRSNATRNKAKPRKGRKKKQIDQDSLDSDNTRSKTRLEPEQVTETIETTRKPKKNVRKANRVSPIGDTQSKKKTRRLNFTPRRAPSKRLTRGKTVYITLKRNREPIQGWIADMMDEKVLIRYQSDSKSSKFEEKWYKKTDKKIKLFDRNQ